MAARSAWRLRRTDLNANPRKYLHGEWTTVELSEWPSETEMTAGVDQLDYEDAYSNKSVAVLFDLGTPEINGEPTNERVQSWVRHIGAQDANGIPQRGGAVNPSA
jgi:hypothetical protein